jgi:hypothetical protein
MKTKDQPFEDGNVRTDDSCELLESLDSERTKELISTGGSSE